MRPVYTSTFVLQADGAAAAEAASPWPALPPVRSDSAAPPPMYPMILLPEAQARCGPLPSSLLLVSRSAPCMCVRATGIQRPPGPLSLSSKHRSMVRRQRARVPKRMQAY